MCVCVSVCCTHVYACCTLQNAQRPPASKKRTALREADLLQQVECQGWVPVDSGEHHHLTQSSGISSYPNTCMLIQDCVTRWGSTLDMLERLMEQQAPIAAVLMDGRLRHLMPEGEEWSIIEVPVDILKPFQQATEAMGAVKYPTLSTVKPLLYKLVKRTLTGKESGSEVAKKVKLEINRNLQERYSTPSIARILNIATFLDLRYKELPFLDEPTRRNIPDQVRGEVLIMEEMEEEEPPEIEEEIQGEPPVKKKKGPVENVIGELFELHTQQHLPSHSQKVENELDM